MRRPCITRMILDVQSEMGRLLNHAPASWARPCNRYFYIRERVARQLRELANELDNRTYDISSFPKADQ